MKRKKPKPATAPKLDHAIAVEKLRRAGNHRRGVAWWAQTVTVLTTIAETAGRMARHPDFTDVFNVEELSRFSARLWDTATELTNNTPALADLELIDPIEKPPGDRSTDLPSGTAR